MRNVDKRIKFWLSLKVELVNKSRQQGFYVETVSEFYYDRLDYLLKLKRRLWKYRENNRR